MLDAIIFTSEVLIMKPCCTKEMSQDNFNMYIAGSDPARKQIMIYGISSETEGYFQLTPFPGHEGYRSFSDKDVMGKLFDVMGWDAGKIYTGSAISCIIDRGNQNYIVKDAIGIPAELIHEASIEDTALCRSLASLY